MRLRSLLAAAALAMCVSGCVMHLLTVQVFPGGQAATTQKAEAENATEQADKAESEAWAKWFVSGPKGR